MQAIENLRIPKEVIVTLPDNNQVVRLKNNQGKWKPLYLHYFIAKAYILNPGNKPNIEHIDGNKRNNNVKNLRWCD